MTIIVPAPRSAQQSRADSADHQDVDAALTREERRRIALASLAIMEQRHRLRLAQIQAERRALEAQAG